MKKGNLNFTTIVLAATTVLCAIGGWFVFKDLSGNGANADIRFISTALVPLLGISGVISLIIGARGYLRAKGDKQFTALPISLNGVMGALAVMMALFFVLP